jgi:hypothetical protein
LVRVTVGAGKRGRAGSGRRIAKLTSLPGSSSRSFSLTSEAGTLTAVCSLELRSRPQRGSSSLPGSSSAVATGTDRGRCAVGARTRGLPSCGAVDPTGSSGGQSLPAGMAHGGVLLMECDRLLATRRGSLRAWHLVAGYGCRVVHTKSNNWRRKKRTFCHGTDRQTGRQADNSQFQLQAQPCHGHHAPPPPRPRMASPRQKAAVAVSSSGSPVPLDFRTCGRVIGHDEGGVPVPAELDGTLVLSQQDVVLHPSVAPGHVRLLPGRRASEFVSARPN